MASETMVYQEDDVSQNIGNSSTSFILRNQRQKLALHHMRKKLTYWDKIWNLMGYILNVFHQCWEIMGLIVQGGLCPTLRANSTFVIYFNSDDDFAERLLNPWFKSFSHAYNLNDSANSRFS